MATCGSCGRDERGDDLAVVRRIYVRAGDPHAVGEAVSEGDVDVRPELENWCLSCRTQYPHQPE